MTTLLPKIDNETYEVTTGIWETLEAEITKITTLIDSGDELQPDDVKNVQALAKQVREYGVGYRKAITSEATNYKNILDTKLEELGYGKVEAYVAEKRTIQNNAINKRLNDKLTKFNSIVNTKLASTTCLKTSSIQSYVVNNLASRFPKLNSGAESKEITNWKPLEAVISSTIDKVEAIMVENPIIASLPAHSQTMRTLSDYLTTGNEDSVTDIKAIIMMDKGLIQEVALKPRVATPDLTVAEIEGIINSDTTSEVKLARIAIVLAVHNKQ